MTNTFVPSRIRVSWVLAAQVPLVAGKIHSFHNWHRFSRLCWRTKRPWMGFGPSLLPSHLDGSKCGHASKTAPQQVNGVLQRQTKKILHYLRHCLVGTYAGILIALPIHRFLALHRVSWMAEA